MVRIVIRTRLHPNPSGRWITVPVHVAGHQAVGMVLDSGAPLSAVSPGTRDRLLTRNLLERVDDSLYRLTSLTVEDQVIPDLQVRVLPRLARLQIDGLLGLDFLRQFVSIYFHVPTFRLELELP